MPIPEFELNADETDDAVLRRDFVNYTMNLLNYIVANNVESNLQITPVHSALATHMQNAWQEWQETSPLFGNLPQLVQEIDNAAVMDHGLYGAQLRFKLANVEWWSQQVNLAEQNLQTAMWIANIWRLLESIDTLLESILAALGVGSALTEIKDSIKNGTQLILN